MVEKDVIKLIQEDTWMMSVIETVAKLELPNWYIGAGFIRSKVWDYLHGYDNRKLLSDIDVLFFDETDLSIEKEQEIEKELKRLLPQNEIPWEVRNQARMHLINNSNPYISTEDAISRFPETVTAIAISLTREKELLLFTPYELTELLAMEVKPTPHFKKDALRMRQYRERVQNKDWQQHWPKIKIDLSC